MRTVRIATVSFELDDVAHSVERNLERIEQYAISAASDGADIFCLPEIVTTMHTGDVYQSQSMAGSWNAFFQSLAGRLKLAIIAPFYVDESNKFYNQASVFDKSGNQCGFYRKLQPTGTEVRRVTPGSDLPVIDLGFAKIAIMICMDIYFPEIARIYAMKGAEILFWPTMTHGPTQQGLLSQASVRAMDNSLVLVEANYAQAPPYAPYAGRYFPGTGRIFDHNGDILAQTGRRPGVAIADVDLDEPRKTYDCFLIDPALDHTRADIESLARMDLFAEQYAKLAQKQKRFYDSIEQDEFP
jgi:predicted amidohydrolase